MNKSFKDITNQRFGRLVAVEVIRDKKRTKWICKCDCGNEKSILLDSLRRGRAKSCGCLRKEITSKRFKKHGKSSGNLSNTMYERLYGIWLNMRSRCNNPKIDSFKNYGSRGIAVCEEWNDFQRFYDWSKNNGYKDVLTIDRINNDGNYEPSNCRWATNLEQMNNTSKNVFTEINGTTKTLAQHAACSDINYFTLHTRYERGVRGKDLLNPSKTKRILIEIDGKIKNLKEWSRHFKISYGTVQYRFCKGLRGKNLFSPVDPIMSALANKRKGVI